MLGFEPGEDGRLAEWPTLVRYYQALARASDRVTYKEIGKTTLGQPFVVLLISSPRNLQQLAGYRAINAKLADPRTVRNAAEAQGLVKDGRTIVLITSSIHSTEVGGHLTPAILAHRLATDTTAATRAMLDDVILLLVPSLNPDGINIVTRWYDRTKGTRAEGSDPPELYHPYVGHDNNRDWYAFTQVETRLTVDSLHNVWHPQIVHDIHQQDTHGSRIFLPPFLDPIEPNVDPLLVDGVNALGTAIAWELAGQGKTGISVNAIYDAWSPARAYQHYHGGVRILSETASAALASPLVVDFDELAADARGFHPRERSWNFTQPWPGGRWTLRDIVTYQTDAAYALLVNAARYRERWLSNSLAVGRRAVRGWRGWPYAYAIPRAGQDTIALATLLGILQRGGVEIRTAQQAFTTAGQRFGAGSYIVILRQPYAAFAKTLLEPQRYPDRRQYPDGPPERPYDATAHTLPLLMGVTAVEIRDSIRVALSPPVRPPRYQPTVPPLRITERGPGGEGRVAERGSGGEDSSRIGLYRSYAESMDEGWTRWVFETWKVPYTAVVDSVLRAGSLKQQFDVIILPDQEPQEILEGLSAAQYPEPYAGGVGQEGADALRQFVLDGGTLVALNRASRFAVQALLLPVRNVLEGLADDEFYAPGSIFRLQLDGDHPVARGMPAQSIAWFEHGPAFEVLDSTVARVIGRYPTDPGRVLLSGWVLHPERVGGRGALVEVRVGEGRVLLFGFRPQYRGQALATYPLLFNSLQLR
ncbi:MAG TPA: M14 family zinc carboxypeptidase [Gemmatimonadales bacterium]